MARGLRPSSERTKKLSALIEEIDRLLGEKYDRLSQRGDSFEVNKTLIGRCRPSSLFAGH
jgi:hypothetical protein